MCTATNFAIKSSLLHTWGLRARSFTNFVLFFCEAQNVQKLTTFDLKTVGVPVDAQVTHVCAFLMINFIRTNLVRAEYWTGFFWISNLTYEKYSFVLKILMLICLASTTGQFQKFKFLILSSFLSSIVWFSNASHVCFQKFQGILSTSHFQVSIF